VYRNILVPLDGSALGEQALPVAIDIARRTGSALHLVHIHVLDLSVLADFPADQPLDEAIQESEQAYLRTVAQRIAASYDGPVVFALREGLIADALHDYALEHAVDLVVLTSHGRGGLARAWLGNTADTLVRTLTVPVLLVRAQEEPTNWRRAPKIAHILVPLDGSALSEQALEPALALGGKGLTKITLLHTIVPIALDYMGLGYGEPIQRAQRDSVTAAEQYLERVAQRVSRPGLTVETYVEIGAPAPSTLHYATDHNVDLIALATHGRSGIARFALGSVADKLARSATLPVLLYRPAPKPARVDKQHAGATSEVAR
jgi:nucleotide-binding universal stress UspA family protein